jgi:hypothetical protein
LLGANQDRIRLSTWAWLCVTADAFGLVLVNLLFLAAGAGVTGAVGWWRGVAELSRSLGVAFLCGVAVYGVTAQLLYVLGAAMTGWQIVLLCAVFAAGIVRGLAGVPHARTVLNPVARWPLIVLGLFILLVAVDLWYQPLWAYDSWTFWTPKAHALWALNGLDPHWFTQANLTSPDYPLLLPSIEAAGFHFSGYETGLLDLQSLLFVVALLHSIYSLYVGRAHTVVLWAVLAMVAAAPSVVDQLAAAEADIPVASMFAVAGACGALWLRNRRVSELTVVAVLAAGACATKVEGIVFAAAIFVSLAVAARAWQPLLAGGGAIAIGVVPWRIWLANHHLANQASYGRLTDLGYLTHHLARVPFASAYLLAKMIDPRAWLLLLPLTLIAVGSAMRRRDHAAAVFVTLTATLSFAGLVLAYWSTRLGLHYQLTTSARRVVTGILFFGAASTPELAQTVASTPSRILKSK